MIKVVLIGALGKMGRTILKAAFQSKDIEIVAAVEAAENPYCSKKITDAIPSSELALTISSNVEQSMSRGDVVIDFSTPDSTMRAIKEANHKELPAVIGTTGLGKEHYDLIKRYARETPLVVSSNMSIGVNVLASMLTKFSSVLQDKYDMEIWEMHHKNKKDAPSGTALYLASSLAAGMNKTLSDVLLEKDSNSNLRGKIGIVSNRCGDVAGEHTVFFAGRGERLELTHRASDRSIFALGALQAARWIVGKEPGLYSMIDVLGLK